MFRPLSASLSVSLPARIASAAPRIAAAVLAATCLVAPVLAAEPAKRIEDEFAKHVRTTEPLPPQEELAGFQVPEGFEVQLVAAEPQIAKPMNLAFDDRGRLWVTSSTEYPIAADPEAAGRDTVKVLEDTDGDGYRETVTTFADGLNIPIGLYPYRDGVVCFSIPNILFLRDTDGDGKADRREVLYGPFDTSRDTHGMCNAFTRGFDGWLYACHGFNNRSTVAGRDGHEINMVSGNTFRIKLDGSRIEHHTHGQVNPFGMAFDRFGQLFTADCHTKPVTLLLRGGYSPSFGAPHDGLGFVPPVMQHLHGSTAIGGIAIYQADQFPREYFGSTFGGNVMTGRINRNRLEYRNGSVRAVEQPDFLVAADPWFRPVDLQVGPDGALYVADFYNRIIGHYEVPLDHPGRDRHRGRIWRIVYKGTLSPDSSRQDADLPDASDRNTVDSLIARFDDPNLVVRMQAVDSLQDRFGGRGVPAVRSLLGEAPSPRARVQGLWYLHRCGALRSSELAAAIDAPSPLVRRHALAIAAERNSSVDNAMGRWLQTGLHDDDPAVVRSAAMAVCRHPDAVAVADVLAALSNVQPDDVHLRHALRMALRNQLSHDHAFAALTDRLGEAQTRAILSVCPAIPTAEAAGFLITHLRWWSDQTDVGFVDAVRYAARHCDPARWSDLVDASRRRATEQPGAEETLLRAVADGFAQRGLRQRPEPWMRWANDLVKQQLGIDAEGDLPPTEDRPVPWVHVPHGDGPSSESPWSVTRRRKPAGSDQPIALISSLPGGERSTGIYRSGTFELPPTLTFHLAGHDGFPDQPAGGNNLVRLVAASDGRTIRQWPAPRTDVATPIRFESGDRSGEPVYLEIVDGDSGTAYAWLAAGQYSHSSLNPDENIDRWRRAAAVAREFDLKQSRPSFARLLRSFQDHPEAAREFAFAAIPADVSAPDQVLAESLALPQLDTSTRSNLCDHLLGEADRQVATRRLRLLGEVMTLANATRQQQYAKQLASDGDGVAALIALVRDGKLAAAAISEPATKQAWELVADHEQRQQLERLAVAAANVDQSVLSQIETVVSAYRDQPGDRQAGRALFEKRCAVCHQVAGQGTAVGPNLDGIGNRGLDRVVEDVLWPGRNVDAAFRTSAVLTSDGDVLVGLIQREQGNQITLVNSDGKAIGIAKDEIEQIKPSELSPMPSDLAASLSREELLNLLRYLLSLRE